MSNIRIRTTPGGEDKYLTVNLNQDFDFVEILSLKLRQDDVYRNFCSDYGAVVGRAIVNNGLGVPNAKVSIFIPIDEIDRENSELFGLYPYEQVTDVNSDGIRYNLFQNKNNTNNVCHTPIGSFPDKRQVQDNDNLLYLYNKYYKFTTTTNQSGDYMFFGVPVGEHQVQIDADLSDIGILSTKPYNLINEGYNDKLFDGGNKFKGDNNLNLLAQVKSKTPVSVNVLPFWGDVEQCNIGITRLDIDLNVNIKPNAIFMGSLFTDNEKNSINYSCRPRNNVGRLSELVTTPGTIEMIRKNSNGDIEYFDINGGNLIDENGTWLYTIPMNLDYVYTNEFGELTPTDDQSKGIPTRARVRFRIKANDTGEEGKSRRRAAYLVPNNPKTAQEVDYTFGQSTKNSSFVDLYWNKIYTVSNHITRVQGNFNLAETTVGNENAIFIKRVSEETTNNPFPYNKIYKTTFGRVDLNFYNDWINGSLYYFLFKYKPRLTQEDKFCNNITINYNTKVVDNCTNCNPQNNYDNASLQPNTEVDGTSIQENLDTGVIYKNNDEGEFYYASVSEEWSYGSNPKLKLYATKIVNLGSLLDCDWQGLPIFYKYLESSTFQIPPEDAESHESGPFQGDVDINGFSPVIKTPQTIWGVTVPNMFNITGVNCNNVKRICELGVGLDEDRRDPITQSGPNADGRIGNNDVESAKVRGLFVYLNSNLTTIPSVYFDFPSSPIDDYFDSNYRNFKGYNQVNPNEVWFFNNSFYFYFGLIPGKTALNRLYSEYLGNC
jgi:hypothetical protein